MVAIRTRLADNLTLVQGPGGAKFPFCNAVLIDQNPRVLIDAGIGTAAIQELDREKRIDLLLLTHSHPDHFLAAHALADRDLMVPEETPESAHDLFELGLRFMGTVDGASYWKNRMQDLYGLKALKKPCARFCDGSILDFGSVKLQAIHLPGHLQDHYAFFEPNDKVLLTTDIDFTGFGPWYGHPEGEIDRFRNDVRQLAALAADATAAVSSHKGPFFDRIGQRFDAFLARFEQQENDVLDLCRKPVTLDTIVSASPFYRNRFPDAFLQKTYESEMVKKNLDRLIKLNKISRKKGVYTRIPEALHAIH